MRAAIIVLLLMLVVGTGVYLYAAPREEPVAAQAAVPATVIPAPAAPSPAATEVAPAAHTITAADITRFAADVASPDASARAAAIAALGDAPRADALPILRNVLRSGEPTVDRPLALKSLHSLAKREGDSDGAIRDLVRQSIYHADTDEFTRQAQTALDDLEALVAAR